MSTIEVRALISALNGLPGSSRSTQKTPAAPVSTDSSSVSESPASSVAPSEGNLQAAAQQIQGYLSQHTDPPQYVVDYLSGMQVMTVRSASSGEVVFQLPNADALRLAQLLHEGAPVNTAGIVDAEA
ncbi:MAG: hypothetical protein ABUL58_02820 [Steroidobacter sp.]